MVAGSAHFLTIWLGKQWEKNVHRKLSALLITGLVLLIMTGEAQAVLLQTTIKAKIASVRGE